MTMYPFVFVQGPRVVKQVNVRGEEDIKGIKGNGEETWDKPFASFLPAIKETPCTLR
eukprot:NODE_13328_length_212_cov_21.288344_g11558_i0.p2 GENE.NODE_13328_length_212_cov_21.288344_g11558_i0~~NODE_13328_length_212_cov_21.288344_g11558_i0.p2  ORF type:complete len:67 (-),score=16.38 NODE_13328_length_212_cov_21.288344_g11558_i0:10-180(-)